jgi:hypothetical protein
MAGLEVNSKIRGHFEQAFDLPNLLAVQITRDIESDTPKRPSCFPQPNCELTSAKLTGGALLNLLSQPEKLRSGCGCDCC